MPVAAAGVSTCSTTIHLNGNPGGVSSRRIECKCMLRFYKFRDHFTLASSTTGLVALLHSLLMPVLLVLETESSRGK
jgi:hypothetical protein